MQKKMLATGQDIQMNKLEVTASINESKRKRSFFRTGTFLCIILITITLFLREVFIRNSQATEIYVRNFYPYISYFWRTLNNYLPVSLTETILVLLIPSILFFIGRGIYRLVKSKNRKATFIKQLRISFTVILLALTYLLTTFFFNFAFAYHRLDLADNLNYEISGITVEQLYEVTDWVKNQVNAASEKVGRNTKLEFEPSLSQNEVMKTASEQYKTVAEKTENEFLKKYLYRGKVRVKPVLLSKYWSYTGITGVFIPFWMESNINTATTSDEKIFTALHEIAHSYGFARENEANFMAFYVGTQLADPDFSYSAWLLTYTYFNNALYSADKELHAKIYGELNDLVRIDIDKRNDFWKKYEGPVQEISEKSNDIYLKTNRQESGVKSYGEVVDLIVAYYFEKIN